MYLFSSFNIKLINARKQDASNIDTNRFANYIIISLHPLRLVFLYKLMYSLGHLDRVWQLDWHPDGKSLATCSGDKSIIIW